MQGERSVARRAPDRDRAGPGFGRHRGVLQDGRAAAVDRQVEGQGERRSRKAGGATAAWAIWRGSPRPGPARGGTPLVSIRRPVGASSIRSIRRRTVPPGTAQGTARRSPGSSSTRRGLTVNTALSRAAISRSSSASASPSPVSRRVTIADSIRVSRRRRPAGRTAAAVARR